MTFTRLRKLLIDVSNKIDILEKGTEFLSGKQIINIKTQIFNV